MAKWRGRVQAVPAGFKLLGTLICVSHGGALRAGMFLLLGTPSFPWNALEGLRNAHWAELANTSRGWRLSVWNVG